MGYQMLDLYAEFKAAVQAFDAAGIGYAVCGGLAYAIHVRPRATVDMDFLVQADGIAGCREILASLGYTAHPRPMCFAGGRVVIHRLWKPQATGRDVMIVDLLVANPEVMPGVWESRAQLRWEDFPVWVVSREGLVTLKRLRGSKQDAADIEGLTTQGDHE
jgi:hypothetical protein